jgi:RNA polymerase sigma-70 factor (ECF subfamily)
MVKRGRGASLCEIEVLYRAELARFRRVAAAVVGDRETACDVVQEAFARAVRGRREFRRQSSLSAWLWRIVLNVARSELRRADQGLEGPWPLASAESAFDGLVEVRAAVSRLPEQQRLILFLRVYADLDYATIADIADVRPGTVGATLNTARAALRETLQEVA